jgi:hypothetical protein
MILLYSLLLLLLSGVKLAVQRRATRLGRAYSALAESVQHRLRDILFKPGNGSKPDPCQLAKVQYELGALVARRDRLEARHFAWQGAADKLTRWVHNLRTWKGMKLPYTLGAVDVWLVLSGIDAVGVGDFVSVRRVVDLVASLLTS